MFIPFNLSLGLAEPALPSLVTGNGLAQGRLVEVGPVGIAEIQF